MRFTLNYNLIAAQIFAGFCIVGSAVSADPNPYEGQGSFFDGPFRGAVVRVIDGDTVVVDVNIWPGTTQRAHIRVRNVDAPETRTSCAAEKELGLKATEFVEFRYYPGLIVRMDDIEPDNFGRFVADIKRWRSDRWLYLAEELVEGGQAIPSRPNYEAVEWCINGEIDQSLFSNGD